MSDMTMRDQFAMTALNGYFLNKDLLLTATRFAVEKGISAEKEIAVACYDYADAMMKARQAQGEGK